MRKFIIVIMVILFIAAPTVSIACQGDKNGDQKSDGGGGGSNGNGTSSDNSPGGSMADNSDNRDYGSAFSDGSGNGPEDCDEWGIFKPRCNSEKEGMSLEIE